MSSVTSIINMISYALIAFVGISLIVSSIMIGVITYVSVLERIKEIGILRAIGASKKDIKRVFNAETLIIGFVAGILGISITYVIATIASSIVYTKKGIPNIATLNPKAALILVLISMFLAFISGLIPASSAAKKDPVEALRSEWKKDWFWPILSFYNISLIKSALDLLLKSLGRTSRAV